MSQLIAMLRSGKQILMDGAMGSELLRAGAKIGECLEAWNIDHPDKVRAVHRAYADAGARVLLTNTFQANRLNFTRYGLQDRLADIVRAGVTLARGCAGNDGFVLGNVGPCVPETIAEIVPAMNDADGILLETWSDEAALQAARICRILLPMETPLLLSFTFRHEVDGRVTTLSGHDPEFFAEQAAVAGVDALGVNCGRDIDMADTIDVVRRYRTVTNLLLFARPNAGTPTRVGDGWEYPYTPERMAEHVPSLMQAGATMIGGCCGTTPEHVAAIRHRLEMSTTPRS